jgi:hypothetical protein
MHDHVVGCQRLNCCWQYLIKDDTQLPPTSGHSPACALLGLACAQVGDCAHGGQVLLSHDAWVMLRQCMPAAGFPVVRCLGLFQLQVRGSSSRLASQSKLGCWAARGRQAILQGNSIGDCSKRCSLEACNLYTVA